jgi:hypothetical protein
MERIPEDRTFKLLFIVGSVRSGSTVLGSLLAELDGFVHVGELHNLWRNLLLDRPCGCGLPLSACPVWSRIRHGTRSTVRNVEYVIQSQARSLQARYLPGALWGRQHITRWLPFRTYRQALREVYESIARQTPARVIIDSSKMPTHVAAAASATNSDAYFIHLVRDPRGVAYSRLGNETMRADLRERATLRRLHLMRSSWQWVKVNTFAELVCQTQSQRRLLRVRYEDLVVDPGGTVESIVKLVDGSAEPHPTIAHGAMVHHTVGGNANRFHTGQVEIQGDTRWMSALDSGDSLVTAVAAEPLFHRYGYRLSPLRRDGGLIRPGGVSDKRQSDQGG